MLTKNQALTYRGTEISRPAFIPSTLTKLLWRTQRREGFVANCSSSILCLAHILKSFSRTLYETSTFRVTVHENTSSIFPTLLRAADTFTSSTDSNTFFHARENMFLTSDNLILSNKTFFLTFRLFKAFLHFTRFILVSFNSKKRPWLSLANNKPKKVIDYTS